MPDRHVQGQPLHQSGQFDLLGSERTTPQHRCGRQDLVHELRRERAPRPVRSALDQDERPRLPCAAGGRRAQLGQRTGPGLAQFAPRSRTQRLGRLRGAHRGAAAHSPARVRSRAAASSGSHGTAPRHSRRAQLRAGTRTKPNSSMVTHWVDRWRVPISRNNNRSSSPAVSAVSRVSAAARPDVASGSAAGNAVSERTGPWRTSLARSSGTPSYPRACATRIAAAWSNARAAS